jgi:hypothetical protein
MLRDPFYRQIYQALEGPLDPQLFERCMGDLLRADYPWIVPVSGGTDSGMDGAIADGEGEPFPLVCTTAADVIRNLTRSLASYLKRGLPRRKVALATSRRLTPRQRENLFKRARDKGFELLQVFEREGVADRLAGSPKWCKELLGLTWKPSALSILPPTHRPLIEIEPVGRESDLAWIVETPGDRVLSGEPGSGKTFLFHHLMRKRDWPGLFLTDTDLREIRAAWLEQRPRVIVVDDAHIEPDFLSRLVRLRQEMEASFEIVAVTWDGGRETVVEALGVPATRVHRLELLTRDEILAVIRNVGVQASEEVLRDLVSQSANKPGLAVTIASLWKQGSYQEVLEGTALTRTLTTFFRRFLGPESTDVLACLALGGNRGMSLTDVAGVLRLTPSQTREIASGLSSGGVISQVNDDVLAVWPRKLRYSLLRSVFFPGIAVVLDYRSLLDLAPSRKSAVETIVASKLHRAEIPFEDLRDLVLRDGSQDSWRGLAYFSEPDALWVLEHYPGDIVEIAEAVLNQAADAAILRLLERAETVSGPTHSQPRHPMRLLQEWVQELKIPLDEMVPRRRLLAKMAKKYLQAKGLRSVGLQGICLALSPALEGRSSDPGAGRTMTLRWGLLPLEQLQKVRSIWAEVRDNLGGIDVADWQHLSSVLWNWMHPTYASKGVDVSEETEQFMRSFAAEILKDIVPSVSGKPGLAAQVRALAQKVGIEVNLKPDPVFELLFPSRDHLLERLDEWDIKWQASLKELSEQWVKREPVEVVEQLVGLEREAQGIGRAWSPRGDTEICRRLAAMTGAPEVWLALLLSQGASGTLTGPFLEAVVESRRVGWECQVERFLELDPQHAWSAVEAILRLPSPPATLFQRALERLAEFPQLLEVLCLRLQIPVDNLRVILRHPCWELALTAAEGEWNADPEGHVRAEVALDWRSAILRSKSDNESEEFASPGPAFWLREILSRDPELAYDWLTARLQDEDWPCYISERSPFDAALSALGREQRIRLLDGLASARAPDGFVGALVEKDPEVFKKVLSLESLGDQHLEPLGFQPDEAWVELATLASQAGYEPEKIARASLVPRGGIHVMWGSGIEDWTRYEQAFARFEDDPRPEVREVAKEGRQLASRMIDQARAKERREDLQGL